MWKCVCILWSFADIFINRYGVSSTKLKADIDFNDSGAKDFNSLSSKDREKLEKEIEKESVPEELERSARQRGRVERETRQSANSRESNRDSNKLQKELEANPDLVKDITPEQDKKITDFSIDLALIAMKAQ